MIQDRYTHYWDILWKSPRWKEAWPRLVRDTRLVFEATDILLTTSGPSDSGLAPPIADTERGIKVNGVGELGHELFYIRRKSYDGFCKTARKPYDAVVACILLRGFMLDPDDFYVS